MKNLFALCIFSLLCSFSTLQAQQAVAVSSTTEIAPAPSIKWDQTINDLGEIPQAVPAEATFTLTNTGKTPLLLKEVKPTCGCTVAAYDQDPILPGESTTIKTTYNAKKAGVFQKTIKVLTNQSDQHIKLKLKGVVVEKKS